MSPMRGKKKVDYLLLALLIVIFLLYFFRRTRQLWSG
jgi:hypothetical protein